LGSTVWDINFDVSGSVIYKFMNKKILILSILLFFGFALPVFSQQSDIIGINIVDNEVKLSNEDPRTITVKMINVVLSFLGLIALVVVLFGGFKWMTSGGNQEQVASAKKILIAGLIGLVIILVSWGITAYIVTQVADITTYP
jgi:hypothetical protein